MIYLVIEMKNKEEAIKLLKKKETGTCFLSYKEIAELTGYHVKYIFKLKKDLANDKLRLEHGNKNRTPVNALSEEEKNKIINLYRRSNASIRKFCKFYNTRSYSCIYNLVKNVKEEKNEK